MRVVIECLGIVIAIVWVLLLRKRMPIARLSVFGAIANNRDGAIVLAGLIGLAASVATGLWRGIPVPRTHDEFCYLMAADTFAHGRLTNRPHPHWEHFESFHLLSQPTFMSKYPPGQALTLALGEVVTGEPIAGVWFTVGLAAAAVCWMLQSWVSPRWASFGGICLGLHLASNDWGQTYCGGTVAAIGGCLLFGAAVRLVTDLDWRTSVALGLGIAILSLTRPYEGLIATIVAAIACCYLRLRQTGKTPAAFLRSINLSSVNRFSLHALLPAGLVVASTGVWLGYDNFVVTGQWWRLPYEAHDAQYSACPTFLFQKPGIVPTYHHKDMERYYVGWERERFLRKRAGFGFNASGLTKVWIFLRFFVGPLWAIPFGLAVWRLSTRGVKLAASALVVALLAMSQTLYLNPHYLAPFTGFVVLIAVQGWRTLKGWGPKGRELALATCTVAIAAPLLASIVCPNHTTSRRSEILASIRHHPGKHLVLVNYGEPQNCHEAWIYNEANLDDAKVVWARSINPSADARLCASFGERTVWRLHVDDEACKLSAEQCLNDRAVAFSTAVTPSQMLRHSTVKNNPGVGASLSDPLAAFRPNSSASTFSEGQCSIVRAGGAIAVEVVGDLDPVADFRVNLRFGRDGKAVRDAVPFFQAARIDQPFGQLFLRTFEGQAEIDSRAGGRLDLCDNVIAIERHDRSAWADFDVFAHGADEVDERIMNRPQRGFCVLIHDFDVTAGRLQVGTPVGRLTVFALGGFRDEAGRRSAEAVFALQPLELLGFAGQSLLFDESQPLVERSARFLRKVGDNRLPIGHGRMDAIDDSSRLARCFFRHYRRPQCALRAVPRTIAGR
jgi:hypothetical protein